jgi:hypothetical protein
VFRYDSVWGGHDNIFNFDCHYPGSADSRHIPGPCPLDHFINPSALRDAGAKFIAAAELEHPPYDKAVGGRGTVNVLVTDAATAEAASAVEGTIGAVGIPAGADEPTLLRLLGQGAAAEAPLLRLSTAVAGTFGGFTSPGLAGKALQFSQRYFGAKTPIN